MAKTQLFVNQFSSANLGSANQDSVIQGDENSAPNSLAVVLDITLLTGTSVALQFLLIDSVSGKKVPYGSAFTAQTGTGTSLYVLGPPGLAAGAPALTGTGGMATLNFPCPSLWAVRLIPVSVTVFTATVAAYTTPLLN